MCTVNQLLKEAGQNAEGQTDQNNGVRNKWYKKFCSSKRRMSLVALAGTGEMMHTRTHTHTHTHIQGKGKGKGSPYDRPRRPRG